MESLQVLNNQHIDPVCGMTVDESSTSYIYKEKSYYFCCNHCLTKFKSTPDSFLGEKIDHSNNQHEMKMEEGMIKSGLYTCPMHPEIEQDHPGDCPKCGMALEAKGIPVEDDRSEYYSMIKKLIISSLLLIPILFLAMDEMNPFFSMDTYLSKKWNLYLQFILTTPIIFYSASTFFVRAYQSLINKSLNMWTLIGLGTGIAYTYSIIATFFPDIFPKILQTENGLIPVYFEAAAAIITLIIIGQVLELGARYKTNSAIKLLMGLQPKLAIKVVNGEDIEIKLGDIQVNDFLRVKPGEKVPVDGSIYTGNSYIDESMITGESVASEKKMNDQVIGGTVNQTGSFVMRAERIGHETLISQIIHLVADAQRSRAPIQNQVDKISAYFVPIVILVSIITFIVWAIFGPEPKLTFALINAIAVLIIACPCALGLATPLSIMVATGKAATFGVLVKDAVNLEMMGKIDTLVVDKTGTLTEGKPEVNDITYYNNFTENELLPLVAGLEKHSEHPISKAVLQSVIEKGYSISEIRDFKSVTGQGVSGKSGNDTILIGSQRFISNRYPSLNIEELIDKDDVSSTIFTTFNGKIAAKIMISDPIKITTAKAVEKLQNLGINIIMATGDNERVANSVASKLGIKNVQANILPEGKLEIIKELQAMGHFVAMTGDGINDAPALAKAQIGIAMGTGTDIAMESAGLVLIKGNLEGIIHIRELSQQTIKNIKQNLILAFGYNTLGIPIAAGILYPFFGILLSPIIASAAMSLSSVSVIWNALRLRNMK